MTFLPIIIAFTLAESIFIVQILPLLPIHPAIAVSLITLFFIAVISFIIPKVARRFGKSLDTATENLRFSEEKFRSHFEYSPVGQSLTGMEETLDVNKSFCNMLGYTEDELKSMNLMTITHPDDIKLTTDRMNELTDGKVKMVRFEKRFFHKNGNIIWVDLSAFLQRDKNRKLQYFISTVSDITANKKMETALKESEANLKELNSTKDKFFSIIAHDLKSPFNAIVGFSNLLTDQIRENDYNGIEQYAEIIQNSSQRALDLLKNLFEWSNLQTGRMEYNPEFTDMAAIIRETVALLSPSSELKSIGISMDLPHDHIIFADKAMIGTILRNLISNAIKFTNPGDQIVISAEQLQHELKVSVWDNGVGIGKEELKKLFRIDESHSSPGTLNETGTGLGLILCREFVEKHGGIIWVESEPGKGSTFCFTIPKVLY